MLTEQANTTETLLATGPFNEALRSAIAASGLSLERIQYRLRARQVRISVATLSYWQSGRSQPERRGSLLALRHLEELLDLPAGSLARLLGHPRRRGRWRARTGADGLHIDDMWPADDNVAALLGQFDDGWDHALIRISHHDHMFIGADRGERSMRSRQLLRADRDGASRWVLTFRVDDPSVPLPMVRALRHCRLGRMVCDRRRGYVVAELLFDRPLLRGETIMIEYEVVNRPPYPVSSNFERKLRFPVREYVMEVAFDPVARPAHCHHYVAAAVQQEPERVRALELDPSHCVHIAKLDAEPGLYGITWGWRTHELPSSSSPANTPSSSR
jgi:transcriptional regulator with XRE-family HTH domain